MAQTQGGHGGSSGRGALGRFSGPPPDPNGPEPSVTPLEAIGPLVPVHWDEAPQQRVIRLGKEGPGPRPPEPQPALWHRWNTFKKAEAWERPLPKDGALRLGVFRLRCKRVVDATPGVACDAPE